MKLVATTVADALVLEPQPVADERGFFARVFDRNMLAQVGADAAVEQANLSLSRRSGTLRGLHYQVAPAAEARVVRCITGAIHDVVLDVRPGSPTFGAHHAMELSAANRRAVYVPPGTAHGFLTLEDDTEVLYQVSVSYSPGHERGVRWDDPAFGIDWPFEPAVISDKDRSWEDFGS